MTTARSERTPRSDSEVHELLEGLSAGDSQAMARDVFALDAEQFISACRSKDWDEIRSLLLNRDVQHVRSVLQPARVAEISDFLISIVGKDGIDRRRRFDIRRIIHSLRQADSTEIALAVLNCSIERLAEYIVNTESHNFVKWVLDDDYQKVVDLVKEIDIAALSKSQQKIRKAIETADQEALCKAIPSAELAKIANLLAECDVPRIVTSLRNGRYNKILRRLRTSRIDDVENAIRTQSEGDLASLLLGVDFSLMITGLRIGEPYSIAADLVECDNTLIRTVQNGDWGRLESQLVELESRRVEWALAEFNHDKLASFLITCADLLDRTRALNLTRLNIAFRHGGARVIAAALLNTMAEKLVPMFSSGGIAQDGPPSVLRDVIGHDFDKLVRVIGTWEPRQLKKTQKQIREAIRTGNVGDLVAAIPKSFDELRTALLGCDLKRVVKILRTDRAHEIVAVVRECQQEVVLAVSSNDPDLLIHHLAKVFTSAHQRANEEVFRHVLPAFEEEIASRFGVQILKENSDAYISACREFMRRWRFGEYCGYVREYKDESRQRNSQDTNGDSEGANVDAGAWKFFSIESMEDIVALLVARFVSKSLSHRRDECRLPISLPNDYDPPDTNSPDSPSGEPDEPLPEDDISAVLDSIVGQVKQRHREIVGDYLALVESGRKKAEAINELAIKHGRGARQIRRIVAKFLEDARAVLNS